MTCDSPTCVAPYCGCAPNLPPELMPEPDLLGGCCDHHKAGNQ